MTPPGCRAGRYRTASPPGAWPACFARAALRRRLCRARQRTLAAPGPSAPHAASRTFSTAKENVRSDAHYVRRTGLRHSPLVADSVPVPAAPFACAGGRCLRAKKFPHPALFASARGHHPRTRHLGHFSRRRKVSVLRRTKGGSPALPGWVTKKNPPPLIAGLCPGPVAAGSDAATPAPGQKNIPRPGPKPQTGKKVPPRVCGPRGGG